MQITILRYNHLPNSTQGARFVDGRLICYTCEDQAQPGGKIAGETRIPPGVYPLTLRTEGGMHKRYAARFAWHRGMLWLQGVPGFEWVYIHVGNTHDHTEGCILVGEMPGRPECAEASVSQSVKAYARLCALVHAATDNGEPVTVRVEEVYP